MNIELVFPFTSPPQPQKFPSGIVVQMPHAPREGERFLWQDGDTKVEFGILEVCYQATRQGVTSTKVYLGGAGPSKVR